MFIQNINIHILIITDIHNWSVISVIFRLFLMQLVHEDCLNHNKCILDNVVFIASNILISCSKISYCWNRVDQYMMLYIMNSIGSSASAPFSTLAANGRFSFRIKVWTMGNSSNTKVIKTMQDTIQTSRKLT